MSRLTDFIRNTVNLVKKPVLLASTFMALNSVSQDAKAQSYTPGHATFIDNDKDESEDDDDFFVFGLGLSGIGSFDSDSRFNLDPKPKFNAGFAFHLPLEEAFGTKAVPDVYIRAGMRVTGADSSQTAYNIGYTQWYNYFNTGTLDLIVGKRVAIADNVAYVMGGGFVGLAANSLGSNKFIEASALRGGVTAEIGVTPLLNNHVGFRIGATASMMSTTDKMYQWYRNASGVSEKGAHPDIEIQAQLILKL